MGEGTTGDKKQEPTAQSTADAQVGAQAVADAVKKAADNAAAAAKRTAVENGKNHDFKFTSTAGGSFEITAPAGLGASGTVKLNGVQLETTEWSTTRIRGKVPAGVSTGIVMVYVDDKVVRRGEYKG